MSEQTAQAAQQKTQQKDQRQASRGGSRRETIVIGAGMVGLATAWFLQDKGHEVTVIDRDGVAAGSSWGNAGWLSPGKAIPLANKELWAYTPKAFFDPDAALHVPLRPRLDVMSFGLRFLMHANDSAWDRTMAALTPIDKDALSAFDELTDNGVDSWTKESPFVVAFSGEEEAEGFISEVQGAIRHGQEVPFREEKNPRQLVPHLSDAATLVFTMDRQRFLEPGPFVHALADDVVRRGGRIVTGVSVTDVNSTRVPVVQLSTGERWSADHVVIATGAWLPTLARKLGVRTKVQAGRGYSFSVDTGDTPIEYPVYLPAERLACTPYQGRFRIAGTMEFKRPDEPFAPQRVESMVKHARTMFDGIDFTDRQDEWVGSRPVTPDGLPLVGATTAPGVYVAGGHGMWGMVLGPATGRALAELITTGETPHVIRPFNPLR